MADDRSPEHIASDEISWRVHVLRENYLRSALLIVIILLVSVGVWYWTETPLFVLFTVGILVVSTAPYFFPIEYRLNRDGIEITFVGVKTFRSWDEYRNFYPHDIGAHLSTFRRSNFLDSFRGNFIRFDPARREDILRFLCEHIEGTKSREGKDQPEG